MATFGGQSSLGTTVENAEIADDTITNAKINSAAAIDRSKLASVAGSGANSDITSLTGLTTVLSEAQGGTGGANMLKNAVGALGALYAKTWFNIQLLMHLWTGSTSGALTTDFPNWVRNSTDVTAFPGGAMASFDGTGADYFVLQSWLRTIQGQNLRWDQTFTFALDWWAIMDTTTTGTINMGFFREAETGSIGAYNLNTGNVARACFARKGTGELYATIADEVDGVTNTDISSGITQNVWNNYRIEVTFQTEVKFYVNGVLKATLSGANLYAGTGEVDVGFGRSDTASFMVTAPNFGIKFI